MMPFAMTSTRTALLRFLAAGAVNTLISYGVYLLFLLVVGYSVADAGAYLAGVFTQYVLHCRFVFRLPMSFRGLLGYPPIHLLVYATGTLVLHGAIESLRVPQAYASLLVIVATLPLRSS